MQLVLPALQPSTTLVGRDAGPSALGSYGQALGLARPLNVHYREGDCLRLPCVEGQACLYRGLGVQNYRAGVSLCQLRLHKSSESTKRLHKAKETIRVWGHVEHSHLSLRTGVCHHC
jgi:hypothetical protein